LHSVTGGNPFFVREVARNLAASAGSDVTVPASVTGLITARVERLSPLSRRLLGAAAVLGEQFAVAVAASVIGQPVMACMRPLEEARDSGLLEATATAGEWRFAHGLVREAVEAGLPVAEKIDLHRLAAETIERRCAGDLAPRLADLAWH
jgi:predicted ATPase